MTRLRARAPRGKAVTGLHFTQMPIAGPALPAALLACILLLPCGAPARACVGDCDGSGQVTVEELVRGVGIALGNVDLSECTALDADANGEISITDLITAVNNALNGCPPTATPTPSASTTATWTGTATWSPTATPTSTATPTATSTAPPTPTLGGGAISVADAVARDAQGTAVRLGQTVTTEGVVTVNAGALANAKLKIFIQSGSAGIMVYDQTSANVPAFQAGDYLRVTGVIRQADPGGGDNPAEGTVLVDVTNGAWSVLSTGNALPTPIAVTLPELITGGVTFTGTLVRVTSVHKVAGDWPQVGDRTTEVTIGDDSGATVLMRFQRPIILPPLTAKLATIGNGPFTATAIVVQNDLDANRTLLSGVGLWVRGADDIAVPGGT
jgi:hypothetical protein